MYGQTPIDRLRDTLAELQDEPVAAARFRQRVRTAQDLVAYAAERGIDLSVDMAGAVLMMARQVGSAIDASVAAPAGRASLLNTATE